MSITPFTHEGSPVRVVIIDDAPHFVAGDVCDYFGVTNRNRVMQHIDSDEKGGTQIDTPGGRQTVTVLTESGLYHLLFILQPAKARGMDASHIDARLQQLANFRRWITSEVLPSIRRHGGYLTPEATEAALTDPDFIIRLATDLKAARAERALAEARAAELAAPAAAWDILVNSFGDYAVADAAKMLSRDPAIEIGRDRLFTWMSDAGWIYRHQGRRPGWRARQSQVDCGRLVEKANAAFQNRVTGEMEAALPTIRITPKGLAALHKRLGGVEPLSPVGAVA